MSDCVVTSDAIALLTANNADPLWGPEGVTALHFAAAFGDVPVVEAIAAITTAARAKPRAAAYSSRQRPLIGSPLHVAAARGHHAVIPALLAAGEDPEASDGLGHSVFDIACSSYWNKPALTAALGRDLATCTDQRPAAPSLRWISENNETGGWAPGPKAGFGAPDDEDHCDIEIWSEPIGGEEFIRGFVSLQRPVLIRGALIIALALCPRAHSSIRLHLQAP